MNATLCGGRALRFTDAAHGYTAALHAEPAACAAPGVQQQRICAQACLRHGGPQVRQPAAWRGLLAV